jgi:hypothetical protein
VTPVIEILAELHARGVRIEPRPHGGVRLVPARLIDADLLKRIRRHKTALLAHLRARRERATADKVLALLNRFRCYALPAGRMPAACEIAQRYAALLVCWESSARVDEADDLASILSVLCEIERELVTLGATPDRDLAQLVGRS